MMHRHARDATAHPPPAGRRAPRRAPPRQDAAADTARACAATAVVSLYRPGEDAAALREGAVYSVAGLVPKSKSAGRRGLALTAAAGSAWRAVDDLGDRCARGGGGVEGRPGSAPGLRANWAAPSSAWGCGGQLLRAALAFVSPAVSCAGWRAGANV